MSLIFLLFTFVVIVGALSKQTKPFSLFPIFSKGLFSELGHPDMARFWMYKERTACLERYSD